MPQANIKAVITAEDRASKTLSGFGNRVQGVGQKIGTAMKAAAVATGVATAALITYSINQFRDIQKNVAGIQALTKNTNEARKALKNAIDFVQGKPFDRLDTIGATKQLLAFGRTTNQIKGDLKTLGNTVLISGIQWQDVTRVYGRVVASGKLLREDFNILNDAGVGLAKTLQDELGTNMQGVFDKMEDGEISAEIFQKALKKAAPDSAVEKSLNTFDNKLLSLKAKFRDIGFAILGVDFNQLSENGEPLVKEGGLLDRMTDGMDALTASLKTINFAEIQEQLGQWGNTLRETADGMGAQLTPKLKALWNTISKELAPALSNLWKNIIQPLIPVIRDALVAAIGLAIDIMNAQIDVISRVINWLSRNEDAVLAVTSAIVGFKATMLIAAAAAKFNAAVAGMKAMLDVYRTQGLRRAIAQTVVFRGLVLTPMVMPAIAVGAALAALGLVIKKALETRQVIRDTAENVRRSTDSQLNAINKLKHAAHLQRDPRLRAHARKSLRSMGVPGYAKGTSFAPGGMSLVGEQGPELVNLPRGSKVHPNDKTRQMMGNTTINITVPMMVGSANERRRVARMLIKDIQDIAAMNGKTATDMLGSKYGLVT